ncbi:MAG TPA: glycoside hydrolase family 3 protein [Candidatus Limnocylindria bacterium]|nr:glycoside hydrolase family 3 protein [Candidatus Limnocylindria bacterium]
MTGAPAGTKLGTGALVWAGFDGQHAPGEMLDAIRDGDIGGVVLFAIRGNVRSKSQVREMLREIQAAARRGGLPPVPVAVDQEGGEVVRVAYRAVFPSAMAIAATGDPSFAERAGRAVAEGLRADGITVNHAPVCDVNVQPRNPVIGTRAFGDDPARVAEFAAAWVRGSEGAGVATTPKHFPGHGDTSADSHVATVDVGSDRATIERRDLPPFRAAFDAGATMVMTAHVRYPALDPERPATISRPILVDLLRGTLGFRGLCITDSLDMSGIHVDSPERVVGRAIDAGVDAVMVTSHLDRQLAAADWIGRGASRARVDEAMTRATPFRVRFGSEVPDDDIDDAPARALAAEIAARSITHVGPPLPRLGGRVRFVALEPSRVTQAEELSDPVGTLERALRARFRDRMTFGRRGQPPDGDGPVVVFTFSASFDADQARRLPALLGHDGVLVALGSPYDATLAPGHPALLSYCDVPVSLEAVAAVLAGERTATGRAPVRLA